MTIIESLISSNRFDVLRWLKSTATLNLSNDDNLIVSSDVCSRELHRDAFRIEIIVFI